MLYQVIKLNFFAANANLITSHDNIDILNQKANLNIEMLHQWF
jgi:hypothetical protein